MAINWSELTKFDYWFEGFDSGSMTAPVVLKSSPLFWFYLWFFSAFVIVAIVLKVSQSFLHNQHPLQKKIPIWASNFSILGVLGLSWFLFREIQVSLLGGRFWLLVGGLYFIAFLVYVMRYFILFYKFEMAYFKKNVLGQD